MSDSPSHVRRGRRHGNNPRGGGPKKVEVSKRINDCLSGKSAYASWLRFLTRAMGAFLSSSSKPSRLTGCRRTCLVVRRMV